MFGVDAPSLIQLVKEELTKEIEVLEGKAGRKSVSRISLFNFPASLASVSRFSSNFGYECFHFCVKYV